ncbi:helix-turn-helix domain-containing protein [Rhizobium nepotum]|uniref:helix-turn-helix domain-containing protein n=1 Tax=Rhizobium nepotum TaxID=1035271 RepID=UPI003CF5F7D7
MATNVNFSLIKGLAILDLITEGRPEITTAIVVNELGMNTATAHRFLMTLEEDGRPYAVATGNLRPWAPNQ